MREGLSKIQEVNEGSQKIYLEILDSMPTYDEIEEMNLNHQKL